MHARDAIYRCDIRAAGPGPARGAYYTTSGSVVPAQRRVGFDVGDSSSEEDGENPNEPPDDGIPPQGSTKAIRRLQLSGRIIARQDMTRHLFQNLE